MPEALSTYKDLVRVCSDRLRNNERKGPRIPMKLHPFRPVILVFFGVCGEAWLREGIRSKLLGTWEGGKDFVRTINIGAVSDTTIIEDAINEKLIAIRADSRSAMNTAVAEDTVNVYFVMHERNEDLESQMDAISDEGFYSWCTEKKIQTILFLMLDAADGSVGESRDLIKKVANKRMRFDGCLVFGSKKTDGTMLTGGELVEQIPLILSDILLLSNTARSGDRLSLSNKIAGKIADRNKMLAVGYVIKRKPVEEIAAAVLEGIIECAKRNISRGRDEDGSTLRSALSREGLLGLKSFVRNDIENLYPEMREVDITEFPYTDKAASFIRMLCMKGRHAADTNGELLLNHLESHTQGVWNRFLKTYFDDVILDYIRCHEDVIRENVIDFLNSNITFSTCLGYLDPGSVNEAVNDAARCAAERMLDEVTAREWSAADFFDAYGKAYGESVFYREVKGLCKEILLEYGSKCVQHQKLLQNLYDECLIYEDNVREYYLTKVYSHAHAGKIDVAQLIRPQDVEVATAERLDSWDGENFSAERTRGRDHASDIYGVLQNVFTEYVEANSELYAVGFEEEFVMREGASSEGDFNAMILDSESMEGGRLLDFDMRYEKPQIYYIIRSHEDWSENMLKKIAGNVLFTGIGGAVERLSLYPFSCTELK